MFRLDDFRTNSREEIELWVRRKLGVWKSLPKGKEKYNSLCYNPNFDPTDENLPLFDEPLTDRFDLLEECSPEEWFNKVVTKEYGTDAVDPYSKYILPKTRLYCSLDTWKSYNTTHNKSFYSAIEKFESREKIILMLLKKCHPLQFRNYRLSIFNSNKVSKLLREYAPNAKSIIDPCAGFGQRARACIKLGLNYTGYDINYYDITEDLKDYIKIEDLFSGEIDTTHYDCLLTCPPYYDNNGKPVEIYTGKNTVGKSENDFIKRMIEKYPNVDCYIIVCSRYCDLATIDLSIPGFKLQSGTKTETKERLFVLRKGE